MQVRGVGFERVHYGDFLNKWKFSLELSHHFYIKYLHVRSELNDLCKQKPSFTKSSLGPGSVWYLKLHRRGGMVSGPNFTQSSELWNPHFQTPHHFRKIHCWVRFIPKLMHHQLIFWASFWARDACFNMCFWGVKKILSQLCFCNINRVSNLKPTKKNGL